MSAVNTDADTDTDADIVLAVPPEEPLSEGTIGFAVDTAARLGAGIRLVHVVPTLVGDWTGTWDTGVGFPELLSQGRVHLEEVAAQVRAHLGCSPEQRL
ncbi:MAG TPA: hypothetical protein PK324_22570, partial [Nocardioides sp.]|nr:hypothetical protein [Nocardioides sp.]